MDRGISAPSVKNISLYFPHDSKGTSSSPSPSRRPTYGGGGGGVGNSGTLMRDMRARTGSCYSSGRGRDEVCVSVCVQKNAKNWGGGPAKSRRTTTY